MRHKHAQVTVEQVNMLPPPPSPPLPRPTLTPSPVWWTWCRGCRGRWRSSGCSPHQAGCGGKYPGSGRWGWREGWPPLAHQICTQQSQLSSIHQADVLKAAGKTTEHKSFTSWHLPRSQDDNWKFVECFKHPWESHACVMQSTAVTLLSYNS